MAYQDDFSDIDTDSVVAQLDAAVAADHPMVPDDSNGVPVEDAEFPEATVPERTEAKPASKSEATKASTPKDDGQYIPKARLDQVLNKSRQVEQALRDTQAELERLKRGANQQTPNGDTAEDLQAEVARLKEWRGQLEFQTEVAQAGNDLKSEIDSIKKEYPDVDPLDLYEAVKNDPSVDLWAKAEKIAAYEKRIEARALERSKAATPAKERPAPIPRPGTAPSPTHGRTDMQRKRVEDQSWDELNEAASRELDQLMRG